MGVAAQSCIIHHAQFEAVAGSPSSPVVTVAGAVARAVDVLSYPILAPPQSLTAYLKFTERGSVAEANARILQISESGDNVNALRVTSGAGFYACYISDGAGATLGTSVAAAAPVHGDLVELRVLLSTTIQQGQSINGAAEVLAAASAAYVLPTAWGSGTAKLWIGSRGGTGNAFAAFQSIKIAAGAMTLAQMRSAF
jgi:hypothetical protein